MTARTARRATTAMFVANGAALGSWVAQIPWIQERFNLSTGSMGLVLVGMSVAVMLVMPLAGRAVVKHGSERLTPIGGVACSLAVILPVLAPHPVLVAAALLVLGTSSATMDVSMNSHGVHVEQRLGRPIMSSLHAGWALGGVLGSGFAAALAALDVDPRLTVLAAAALLVAVVLGAATRLGTGSAAQREATPGFTLPTRGVVLLAVLCLLVMLTEGAMAGWGGLYLRQDLGTPAALAALAYAFFTAGMLAGRLAGDRVNARIGSVALLRLGALLTGVPLAVTLLLGSSGIALAGLFAVGIGVANGVPLLFSAAGRQTQMPSGLAIAAVASVGSLGFLTGPPIIGFLAEATSLPTALAILMPAAAAVFVFARRAVGAGPPSPRDSHRPAQEPLEPAARAETASHPA